MRKYEIVAEMVKSVVPINEILQFFLYAIEFIYGHRVKYNEFVKLIEDSEVV